MDRKYSSARANRGTGHVTESLPVIEGNARNGDEPCGRGLSVKVGGNGEEHLGVHVVAQGRRNVGGRDAAHPDVDIRRRGEEAMRVSTKSTAETESAAMDSATSGVSW